MIIIVIIINNNNPNNYETPNKGTKIKKNKNKKISTANKRNNDISSNSFMPEKSNYYLMIAFF
jgi:hypothetical protein